MGCGCVGVGGGMGTVGTVGVEAGWGAVSWCGRRGGRGHHGLLLLAGDDLDGHLVRVRGWG